MNWTEELVTSFFWILKNLFTTFIIFSLLIFVLVKTTKWGYQFWTLAKDFISPKRSSSPLFYFWTIVFFNLLSVRIDILFSDWYKAMYDALQEMNVAGFWLQMLVFSILATVHIFNILLTYYISQRFQIQWRIWLNKRMLNKWTANQAYYKTQYALSQLDNPDQRIQQDVDAYISNSLSLAIGVISSTVSLVAFSIILWDQSGPMEIAGYQIPHMMVFLVFIYVLISSVIAFKIGKPLIKLNFANEWLNANYRYSLIRLKEYAESIAFYGGEVMEKSLLLKQFDKVIQNIWKMVYRTLKLSGFNIVVSQISVIFPFIIQASRYFAGEIKLGDLIQTAQAFGKVQSALSFYRNSYDNFASYCAVLERLTGFNHSIDSINLPSNVIIKDSEHNLIFENLTINTPNGKTLIENINLNITQGTSLLIKGPSGVGKTTLLRTIAGLWQYSEGTIYRPIKNALFISQKTYLPQGRLIDAMYYPEVSPEIIDINYVKNIINQVNLGHLVDKLEQEDDWTRVLSLGEQQRLAFARLVLHKPKIAFLDEATASMDEGLEDAMYRLLRNELKETTIISVGHRSTLHLYHQQQLQISADGSWKLTGL
ncbi:putative ATP-binding cassette transporter [Bisgaardia hudsonensis]|uniref:Putative ATP-binding cassette transporter n=1 Tax=Bisgaardia hudsonensis TaxID=109472 RepID=A0A4R2MUH1_9PAST|nr:ABC transporter ATP-binding protein/permease [Bisgaardia hudsonensis]QLB12286.1 ABC transporter ATP-binding protein [Bisgaardia hudsonensis]TCP12330.1 putative ATP-binding cassette transporter [Bisgaardia hudsonensis]